ncbi:hypothetical protein ACEPAF_4287 [Sanghuangporus sanghuang]
MSATIEEVSQKGFDYVIIGGGTAGLTLAARLSEDTNLTVVVIEAGLERLGDQLIDIPGQYGKHFGNASYSWDFATVPQVHSNGVSCAWPRGKVLGGSSAINFYVWTKPPAADIDAWETLGSSGWNWTRFSTYSKKIEGFAPPDKEAARKYRQEYNIDAYGTSGPLKISFPQYIIEPEIPFQQTLLNAGIKLAKDPHNGDVRFVSILSARKFLIAPQPIGTWMSPCTIDRKTQSRSYAAEAFYRPNAHRRNLRVLCGALVLRVHVKEGDEKSVRATAVEFEYEGNTHSVLVEKEVILCAGALKSPQVLELSGIGRKDVLEPLGIRTMINLPGVGINMQEHMLIGVIYELDPKRNFETLDSLHDESFLKEQLQLYKEQKGACTISVSGFTFLPLSTISSSEIAKEIINRERCSIDIRKETGSLSAGLQEQYRILLESYERGTGGECEIICFPGWFGKGAPETGKNYVTIMMSFNHPFSRGVIHISTADAHDQPIIDPHCFEEPIDIETMTETVKFIRRISQIEPFNGIIAREVSPGPSFVSDGQLQEFIKDNIGTTFHTVGTLSMLPRDFDGVVDPSLRVYGAQNVRVADLSIVPLHIASHTQSTAYMIGEVAADIIRGHISE